MINAISALFVMLGTVFLSLDLIIPFVVTNMNDFLIMHSEIFPLEILGIVFVGIGVVVYLVRSWQTGTSMFHDLPSGRIVPCIHSRNQGKDPDAYFMRARRLDLEVIKAKNKLIKDTGGGIRIGGHGVRRTYETIGFTVPEWLSAYFHTIKMKYGIKNKDEFHQLREALKGISDTKDFAEKEKELTAIALLKPIMADEEKKKVLLAKTGKELRDLDELLFDGITHNGEDVELFIDSATPTEQDILTRQTIITQAERARNYKGEHGGLAAYLPWIIIAIIVVVAFFIIASN